MGEEGCLQNGSIQWNNNPQTSSFPCQTVLFLSNITTNSYGISKLSNITQLF